jgi:hypothetical protein
MEQTKKAKNFKEAWIARFGSDGPYNVTVEEQDCGAVYLAAGGKVLAVGFSAPNFELQKIQIPEARHTCANHLTPKDWDELHLAGYGDAFGIDLKGYVGVFQSAMPGKAATFNFTSRLIPMGPGEWEASSSGG